MADKKYKVIVSDRAKQMLGVHFRFMTQVNKEAAAAKKKELSVCLSAFRSLKNLIYHRINIIRCSWKSGI